MTGISEIIIAEQDGFFFKKNFKWSDISNFSVIAGINGSGKTKLLNYISKRRDFNQEHLIRYVDIDYKPPLEKHANVIENQYQYRHLEENGKYYALDKTGAKHDWDYDKNNFINNGVIGKIDYAILGQIINERKAFNNDIDSLEAEIFRRRKYKKTNIIFDLLPSDLKDDKPWDRIDRILNDFGLFIRVDRTNLAGGLEFIRKTTEVEITLEMKDLSSGERVAFAVALWTWGNSSRQRTDILLVDEFDAHLNPSIAKQFVLVIKKYFIDLGVQVIMTTHNPSTIVYAKESEAKTIWMCDGLIEPNMEYSDIIKELSNGLIDIHDMEKDLQLLIKNSKKCVLYTEGKTDEKHILSAIKALKMEEDFKDIFIFGCTGAQTVPRFMQMPTNQEKQIVLFDSDKEGREVFKKIEQNESLKERMKKKKLKRLFVSCKRDKCIENLFEDSVGANKGKAVLANFMSIETNQTEENFKKFKPLLSKIHKIANL